MSVIDATCALATWVSAAVLLSCAAAQMLRSHSHELSLRTASVVVMLALAVTLAGAAWRGDVAALSTVGGLLASSGAVWLVWVPHQHPALVRASTGFGFLDDDAERAGP